MTAQAFDYGRIRAPARGDSIDWRTVRTVLEE